MDFFIFYPRGFLFGLWFFKSADLNDVYKEDVNYDVFIRKIFHLLPLWFFRYHSTISCGFYSARGLFKSDW